MITIYDHPRDFPDHYVARLFLVDAEGPAPTTMVLIDDDLDALREKVRRQFPDFICLSRDDSDDPVIVETWI